MIAERSDLTRGWALFSDDRAHRFRLARSFTPWPAEVELQQGAPRVTFVMLNPSTADAFKPDPTVSRCCDFAKRLGADVLEVVNLFSLRSPKPTALKAAGSAEAAGATLENDAHIMAACRGAQRVIAAWGLHGHLWMRAATVRDRLCAAGIKLEILALSSGMPRHPMARGRNRIPDDAEPFAWVAPTYG
jgi:hypothetical protein